MYLQTQSTYIYSVHLCIGLRSAWHAGRRNDGASPQYRKKQESTCALDSGCSGA